MGGALLQCIPGGSLHGSMQRHPTPAIHEAIPPPHNTTPHHPNQFAMQLYFRPTTTKMLGNLKIFTIALLMRTVMHRQFSVIQYEALFLLVAGITVNQLHSCGGGGEALPAASVLPALLCVAGSVTVPSAASVYNEFALKKHMDTSVHLQNFFLYFYGALFNLAGVLGMCLFKGEGLGQLLVGHSKVTAVLIVNNAAQVRGRGGWRAVGVGGWGGAWWADLRFEHPCVFATNTIPPPPPTNNNHNTHQGILSSFFYKFADTILKKYSSTIATIFTALMSWALFAHPLTANFALGVSIVFVSMHQFFTFGDKKGAAPAAAGAAVAGGGGGAGGAGDGSSNGVMIAANASGGWATKMIHSPSMEHFRVQTSALGANGVGSGGALSALSEDEEVGGGGSRAPLLPR